MSKQTSEQENDFEVLEDNELFKGKHGDRLKELARRTIDHAVKKLEELQEQRENGYPPISFEDEGLTHAARMRHNSRSMRQLWQDLKTAKEVLRGSLADLEEDDEDDISEFKELIAQVKASRK